jgi:hypothetical protein
MITKKEENGNFGMSVTGEIEQLIECFIGILQILTMEFYSVISGIMFMLGEVFVNRNVMKGF